MRPECGEAYVGLITDLKLSQPLVLFVFFSHIRFPSKGFSRVIQLYTEDFDAVFKKTARAHGSSILGEIHKFSAEQKIEFDCLWCPLMGIT